MVEPVSVTVVLQKFATLIANQAGKALAGKIAQEFVSFALNHLATKRDVINAVNELKEFIDQQFDDFYDRTLDANIYSAKELLKSYLSTNDLAMLSEADAAATLAAGWVHGGVDNSPGFARSRFIIIINVIVVHVAVWAAKADANENNVARFLEILKDYARLIEKCITEIESFESETFKSANLGISREDDMSSGEPKPGRARIVSIPSYVLAGIKYSGGSIVVSSDMTLSVSEGKRWLEQRQDYEIRRINAARNFREAQIYQPAREVVHAMNSAPAQLVMLMEDFTLKQ